MSTAANTISPGLLKEAHFFVDVPQDLIDVINRIDYGRISPDEARTFLDQLNQLADKYDLPRRTQSSATKIAMVNKAVPDEAIKAVNQRDYSRIPRLALSLAKPKILKTLKQLNLIR